MTNCLENLEVLGYVKELIKSQGSVGVKFYRGKLFIASFAFWATLVLVDL